MKFTKTAVAVAIAGIASAPMIASADTVLSGVVEIQLNGSDADGDDGDARFAADDVLFGIQAEHALNVGLTGYGSVRVDINRLSDEGRTTIDPGTPGNDEDDVEVTQFGSADAVYVGIKGGFGDVRLGEIPVAVELGQVANDIFDVTGDITGGISYTGGFGPATVVANFSPEQNEDVIGIGGKLSLFGFGVSAGYEERADVDRFAVGATYGIAGVSLGAHYWLVDEEGGTDGDLESVSVQLGYGYAGISGALTISAVEDDGPIDSEAIRLDVSYGLGGGMTLSSRITAESDNNNGDNDLTSWRIKLGKSF